jgi:hypothetical protein
MQYSLDITGHSSETSVDATVAQGLNKVLWYLHTTYEVRNL